MTDAATGPDEPSARLAQLVEIWHARLHRLRGPRPRDPARAVGPAHRPRRLERQGQRRAHRPPRGGAGRQPRGDHRGRGGAAPQGADELLHRAGRARPPRPRHGVAGRRDRAGRGHPLRRAAGRPPDRPGRPRRRRPRAASPGTTRPCSTTGPLDVWMHEQDIRRAIGRPGGYDCAAADHVLRTFGRGAADGRGQAGRTTAGDDRPPRGARTPGWAGACASATTAARPSWTTTSRPPRPSR